MSSEDPFSNPSDSGTKITEFNGSLLIVEPLEYKTGVKTAFGDDKDLVVAKVTVLDGEHSGEVYDEIAIFQGGLIGQTRRCIGKRVLGRLGQTPPKQKGMSPAWNLADATDAERKVALDYINNQNPFAS